MTNSTKTLCVFLFFVFVCFFFPTATATASSSPLSDDILKECDTLFFNYGLTHCFRYFEKGSRRPDNPSNSCCSMVRAVWNVYPTCVNANVLDGVILTFYDGFDRDNTRVAKVTSACGIVDGSGKLNARPLVAASLLEARSPVAASPLSA